MRPAIQTGTSNGLTITNWNGTKPARPPSADPAMLRATVSCGQPCTCCQITYGAARTPAAATPPAVHHDHSCRRGPTASSVRTTTTATSTTCGFASEPIPTTIPAASIAGPLLRTIARITSQTSAVVLSRSNVVVVTK